MSRRRSAQRAARSAEGTHQPRWWAVGSMRSLGCNLHWLHGLGLRWLVKYDNFISRPYDTPRKYDAHHTCLSNERSISTTIEYHRK